MTSQRLYSIEVDTRSELLCPRCGAEMEEIDSAEKLPTMHELRLCSKCYLVEWQDETGFQLRQGVPVSKLPNA